MEKGLRGNIPILLLAAGASSRMGQSKQLLPIAGTTLIRSITKTCLTVNSGKVIVVLGANENKHKEEIQDLPVEIVVNPDWSKGVGSSIKAGINYLMSQTENTKGVIISVCDQPYLAATHLNQLIENFETKKMVASAYKGARGVPVLFDAFYFDALLQIDDENGANKIIQMHAHAVKEVPFPRGDVDLDTVTDYNTFNDNAASP